MDTKRHKGVNKYMKTIYKLISVLISTLTVGVIETIRIVDIEGETYSVEGNYE
jgi:hypothetical protein